MAELTTSFKRDAPMDVTFENIIKINDAGTSDYNRLINLPKINEVKIIGSKSLEDLGINTLSNIELEELLK